MLRNQHGLFRLCEKNKSKINYDILSETQPSDVAAEFDNVFLEHVVKVSGDQPSPRKRLMQFAEIGAIRIKFFRRACDVAPFAALSVRML